MFVIVIVVMLFAALVLMHEAGHFIVARRNGVEAEEFGLGFPPRIWGRRIGRTLYSINLLPLGGFVRLKGEDGSDQSDGTFGAASTWKKSKILLAGVIINFVTALVIMFILCLTGLPGLGDFEPKFLNPSYALPKQLFIGNVGEDSPAAKAGLRSGDYLLSVDGTALTSETQLRDYTRAHAGQTVNIDVRQGDERRSVDITLRPPDAKDGYLGVSTQPIYRLRYKPLEAVVAAGYITGALFVATIAGVISLILHLPNLVIGLFGNSVPPAAGQASGPLGIFVILQSIASLGWAYVWLFVANIAVALAAFNVLPIPALDGGRLAVILFGRVTGRKFKPQAEALYHTVGFVALIGLIALITVYDFRKFF